MPKTPRPAASYRGARRNQWRTAKGPDGKRLKQAWPEHGDYRPVQTWGIAYPYNSEKRGWKSASSKRSGLLLKNSM